MLIKKVNVCAYGVAFKILVSCAKITESWRKDRRIGEKIRK